MIKINRITTSFRRNFNKLSYLLFALIGVFFTYCQVSEKGNFQTVESKIEFVSNQNHLNITGFTDVDSIADSISVRTYSSVYILNSQLNNYDRVLRRIRPDSLIILRLSNDESQNSKVIDLHRFGNLKEVYIEIPNLSQLKLIYNKSCRLNRLGITGGNFPEFDSSLTSLESLYYTGIDDNVPKWVEVLDSLETLFFASPNIQHIECDLCKMKKISTFDISESNLYREEMLFYQRKKRYNKLSKFIICKPNLQFKYRIPAL